VIEWFCRLERFAWIPITLSAAALFASDGATLLLTLAAALFLAAPLFLPEARRWRALTGAALLFFLAACGWAIYYRPDAPIELFEDGQILTPAQTYASGGRPYLDTYPIHGWGADGGVDGFFFRLLGPSLRTFWWRRAAATALALSALGLASGVLFGGILWGAVGLVCALGFCPFLSERHLAIFVALALLLRAARQDRPRDWFLSGILCAVTVFVTLDFGLVAVIAAIAASILLAVLDSRRKGRGRATPVLALLSGIGAGGLPFLAILGRDGAASAFFRVSFLEIPKTITDTWGLPAGSASLFLRSGSPDRVFSALVSGGEMPSLFLLVILGGGTTLFLLRSARGILEPVDRAAGAALAVAGAACRGVLGRADAGHLALYGVFAGLPAAWILYRAARARRHPMLLSAAVLALLLARLHLHRVVALEAGVVADAEGARGAARGARPQAAEISALRRYFDSALAPGQTFFDFGNEPALYFLLGRTPPTRYACVPFYEAEEKQREVVEALERLRPPLAILAGGGPRDAFDGVSNRERAPHVAAYLDAHYEPAGKIHGRIIGMRIPDSTFQIPGGSPR
jgi:hypothetical protein